MTRVLIAVGIVTVIGVIVWRQATTDQPIATPEAKSLPPQMAAPVSTAQAAHEHAWSLQDEPPDHGPELLQLKKFERGTTVAALRLTEMRMAHLKTLAEPSEAELRLLAEDAKTAAALQAQYDKQTEFIDAFDVNAPAPDRSP